MWSVALIGALLTAAVTPAETRGPLSAPMAAGAAPVGATLHRPRPDQLAVLPFRRPILRSVPGQPGIPGGGTTPPDSGGSATSQFFFPDGLDLILAMAAFD